MRYLIILLCVGCLRGEIRETNLGVVGEINAEAGKAYRLVVDEVEGPVVTGIRGLIWMLPMLPMSHN